MLPQQNITFLTITIQEKIISYSSGGWEGLELKINAVIVYRGGWGFSVPPGWQDTILSSSRIKVSTHDRQAKEKEPTL